MNVSQRITAQRYAAAYDALNTSAAGALRRNEQLQTAALALKNVQAYMQSPRICRAAKKQCVQSALADLPAAASFIALLIDEKRYDLLPEIARHVQLLCDERNRIVRASVTSASPLSARQKEEILAAIGVRYHAKAQADFSVDKTLLGGLVIVCNQERIDGSLKGKFSRLQQQILKQ